MKKLKELLARLKGMFSTSESSEADTEIGQLKMLVKRVIQLIASVKNAKSDGKISTTEYMSIAMSAIPLMNSLRDWEGLKAELLDLNSESGIELFGYLYECGLLPARYNEAVTHALSAIEGFVALYKSEITPIVDLIKKQKEG